MLVKLVSREMSSQCYKGLLMGHKSCVILTDTAITMIYGGNTMKTHHIQLYHHLVKNIISRISQSDY